VPPVIRVSELIAADGRRWDEAALDQNLLFMDAQAVKSIPLGRIELIQNYFSAMEHCFSLSHNVSV